MASTRPAVPIHISSLPTPLRLVSIPHRALVDNTHALLRLLLSPAPIASGSRDRFLNVTRNAVELSIFADEALVRRSFAAAAARADRAASGHSVEEVGGAVNGDRRGEDAVEVSREVWIALQVEQEASSDDDWESAGARVKELSHPLAADGISILFLSTYLSDYLLVKQPDLPRVFDRLGGVGFTFDAVPDDVLSPASEPSQPPFSPISDTSIAPPLSPPTSSIAKPVTGRMRSSTAISSTLSSSSSPARDRVNGSVAQASISLSGSVVLSERGSISTASSSPATPSRGPSVTMSRTTTQEIPPLPASPGVAHFPDAEQPRGRPNGITRNRRAPSAPAGVSAQTLSKPLPVAWRRSVSVAKAEEQAANPLFEAVAVLPDELICVGLDRACEAAWMTAVIKALLFPEDVVVFGDGDGSPSRDSAGFGSRRTSRTSDWPVNSRITGDSAFTLRDPPADPSSLPHERQSRRRSSASSLGSSPAKRGARGFVSITQTVEEASLTADLALLRALFPATNDEAVFTVGNGGLRGRWRGEGSSWRRRSKEEDEGAEGDEEGEEEDGWEDGEVQAGRTVMSCLQIDLSSDSSFGLDRHGVVDMLSDRLLSETIPMLYTSTFKTANVLVPKSDLHRALQSLDTRRISTP